MEITPKDGLLSAYKVASEFEFKSLCQRAMRKTAALQVRWRKCHKCAGGIIRFINCLRR